MRVQFVITLISVATFSLGRPVEGQSSAVRRVPVLVMLSVNRLQASERFLIYRDPGKSPADVIVLAPNAGANELGKAVEALLRVRKLNGDLPVARATFRRHPTKSENKVSPRVGWTRKVIADVQSRDIQAINGVGEGRTITIWLPPQGVAAQ